VTPFDTANVPCFVISLAFFAYGQPLWWEVDGDGLMKVMRGEAENVPLVGGVCGWHGNRIGIGRRRVVIRGQRHDGCFPSVCFVTLNETRHMMIGAAISCR